jgi:hypothetical protein
VDVAEGDTIVIEREYADGHKEERQLFPQATSYRPSKPGPWKERNDK